jgi:hypothetical protein
MSLFALNHEFQRSIYSAWKEFSASPNEQAELDPQAVESRSHQSVPRPGNQREGFVPNRTRNVIKSRVADESTFMQHDAKAWGRFLDSKTRE